MAIQCSMQEDMGYSCHPAIQQQLISRAKQCVALAVCAEWSWYQREVDSRSDAALQHSAYDTLHQLLQLKGTSSKDV